MNNHLELKCHGGKKRDNGNFFSKTEYGCIILGLRHLPLSKIDRIRAHNLIVKKYPLDYRNIRPSIFDK